MTREEAIERIKMILEEATANEDAVSYVTSDDTDALDMSIKALEQEPCETIKEIPKDYYYDTETEDFLVYRHKYTGHEIHIEKPVPRYRLEQEPILDKIRAEIETQEKWLAQSGYNAYNVDIAFNSIKLVLAETENGK